MWEHDGLICTGKTCKTVVKLTFAKGASLQALSPLQRQPGRATPGAPSISMRATRSMVERWFAQSGGCSSSPQ